MQSWSGYPKYYTELEFLLPTLLYIRGRHKILCIVLYTYTNGKLRPLQCCFTTNNMSTFYPFSPWLTDNHIEPIFPNGYQ